MRRLGDILDNLNGATEWLSQEVSVDDLRGQPLLIQFWAVSCPICKINMPQVQRIRDEYASHGIQLISMHMPRKEARRKFEGGQTTRRAALRKIGITAGAAFFAMFGVDDLARIAGKRLEQMQIDNKIADDLAKELRSVGVAFAGPGSPSGTPGPCSGPQNKTSCEQCNQQQWDTCYAKAGSSTPDQHQCNACQTNGLAACDNPFGVDWPGMTNAWGGACSDIMHRP